ncbi:MAG TPA: Ig-like domain-containing protein [Aggregatilineales bacterium]|nr:Ig-like domain-containing protein [Aggregatilineales bacterium]
MFLRRILHIALLTALAGTLVYTEMPLSTAAGQSEAVSFAHILDLWPTGGVEVLPSEALTITFDQPMDQASVEAAVQTTPSVPGTFNWQDAQTVTFTPVGGWPRKVSISVSIGISAKSAGGAALDNATHFTFDTMPDVEVTRITPEDGSQNVAPDSKILVAFDRPVVPLTSAEDTDILPSPIMIDPPISGKGMWTNTMLYIFTPDPELPGGATYTITVPAGLVASDGTALDAPAVSKFHVLPPAVQAIDTRSDDLQCQIDGVTGLDCPINVKFTQPMAHSSVQAAFSVTEDAKAVSGTFTWAKDDRAIRFQPSQRLQPNSAVQVTVAGSAQNKARTATMAVNGSASFTTVPLPSITKTEPADGDKVDAGYGVSISFSTLMKFSTVKDRVHITPLPSDLNITRDNYYGSYDPSNTSNGDGITDLRLDFIALPATTYTVTLDAGAQDIYGDTISIPYKFSFATKPLEAQAVVAFPILNGSLMTTSAADGHPAISMLVRGKATAHLTVYALKGEAYQTPLGNYQFGDYCRGNDGTMGFEQSLIDISTAKLKPLREWDESFNEDPTRLVRKEVPLAAPSNIMAPGMYLVRSDKEEFVLAVSTANITLKRSESELFAWVTDQAGARPLANVSLTLYNLVYGYSANRSTTPQPIAIGKTDVNGTLRFDLSTVSVPDLNMQDQEYYVVAQGAGIFGMWYSCPSWYSLPPNRQSYMYSDRPIYRPGETVHVKGIVRAVHDVSLTPLRKTTAHLDLFGSNRTYSSDEKPLLQTAASVSALGTFTADFKLPSDAPIGETNVYLSFPDDTDLERERNCGSWGYGYCGYGRMYAMPLTFTIAAFRPPDIETTVTPSLSEIVQGDPLSFDVAASYYSGGAANKTGVTWNIYSQPAFFQYKGTDQSYRFDDERWLSFSTGLQETGSDSTNDNGKAHISAASSVWKQDKLSFGGTDYYPYPGEYYTQTPYDPAPGVRPVAYIAEATLTDESSEPVSNHTEPIMAHPANVYVGISADSWGAPAGKPLPIHLIAVQPDSTPLASQIINVSISRISWRLVAGHGVFSEGDQGNPQWQEQISPVANGAIKTNENGIAGYDFTPPDSGTYRVAAESTDKKGRINSATLRLYVSGQDATLWNDPLLQMTPTADKSSYKPGDVATFHVPLGFDTQSLVLVTVERNNVIRSDVVKATSPILTYQLPIQDSFAPGAFVSFVAYRGVDSTHPVADYRYGEVQIAVDPSVKRLKVTLAPSTTKTTPGGKVAFNVLVTDRDGKPVSAEVGLALVDKSVLALVKPNTPSLESAFYSTPQYNYVFTNLSMFGDMQWLTNSYVVPCCFGGGGGPPPDYKVPEINYIRSNFKFTALWAPTVQTDTNGKATVSVALPDNATTWFLDARAVTTDTLVGQGNTEMIATLPLLMRPIAPRFMVAGDRVQLAAVVNNNSGMSQMAQVSLIPKGVTFDNPASATQSITIPEGGRAKVTWNVTVNDDAEAADLVYSVVGQNGFKDAARPLIATGPGGTIPIYRYLAYDNVATAGSLLQAGSRAEAIRIPQRIYTGQGETTVTMDGSLATAMLDTLTYLKSYPYDCNEQTSSKALPNIFTLAALKKLNVNDPILRGDLDGQITAELKKLEVSRNADGWGWWPNSPTDPMITAYVILTLTEGEDAGYKGYLLNDAPEILQHQLVKPDDQTSAQELNLQAFYLYVLTRYNQVFATPKTWQQNRKDELLPELQALYARRTQLNVAARAFLLMGFAAIESTSPEIASLADDISSAAVTTATTTHWEEINTDWMYWDTNNRSTALAMRALIAARPQSPLLPGAVRWLMDNRHSDHWETTQETAWSIAALTDWMVTTNELNGNFTYRTALNGDLLRSGLFTPQTVRTPDILHIDTKDLLPDKANVLSINRGSGPGALYYTADLKLYAPANEVKAINRGIAVTRDYFQGDKTRNRVTTVQQGDVVTVRLTFTVSQNMRYFVLEDPFPAGMEAVDTSLLTTSLAAKSPDLSQTPDGQSSWYWYWGWWYVDRTEIRDQQMDLYASYLPRGTYTFTYQLRATVAGQFRTMPTHANPFYYPDVFGRSDGTLFTVLPTSDHQ